MTLAESEAFLRALLDKQMTAERELNDERIAVGLPPKQFVSAELRNAVAKLDKAKERARAQIRSDESRAETASEARQTSDSETNRSAEQRREIGGQND